MECFDRIHPNRLITSLTEDELLQYRFKSKPCKHSTRNNFTSLLLLDLMHGMAGLHLNLGLSDHNYSTRIFLNPGYLWIILILESPPPAPSPTNHKHAQRCTTLQDEHDLNMRFSLLVGSHPYVNKRCTYGIKITQESLLCIFNL